MRMLIVLYFAFVISYDATASDVAASGPRSTITRIPDANTTAFKSNAGPVFFNADSQEQSYVTVNLVAFDIAKDERLWRDYEPLVEVRVRIGDSEFAKVLGPSQIHSTGTRVRSVNNELILGPIPYDGREAVVTVNLRRAAVRDRLGETMSAAQSVAGAFGVGDVVEFTKVSQSLIGVFNKYFAPDSVGVVSFRKTWVPWSPSDPNESSTFREGYYAIHPQSARLDSTKFSVDDDDRVSYAGLPLHRSGTDIAIIRFNHSVERRDYRTRPFYGKYDVAQVAAKSQSVAEFDRAFDSAMSVLEVDKNFTEWNRKILRLRLYEDLVPELRARFSNFQPRSFAFTRELGAKSGREALVRVAARGAAIEAGRLQPGEAATSVELAAYLAETPASARQGFADDLARAGEGDLIAKIQRLDEAGLEPGSMFEVFPGVIVWPNGNKLNPSRLTSVQLGTMYQYVAAEKVRRDAFELYGVTTDAGIVTLSHKLPAEYRTDLSKVESDTLDKLLLYLNFLKSETK